MVPSEPAGRPGEAPGRTAPSRRAVLLGAAGVGVAAGGLVTARMLHNAPGPAPAGPPTVARLLEERPFRIAHRGGSDDWPEMSEYAYRHAVAHGYRALEISVARSADGVWFGLHDRTLDRTSGTTGFAAADHTWAEIRAHRITAAATTVPTQPARPYLSLRRFLGEFGRSTVVFVDPKAADARFHPQLLELVGSLVAHPPSRIVAKGPGSDTAWAALARRHGLRTWGFYSARDVEDELVARTAHAWDLLGMAVGAPADAWAHIRSFGKPVIAHVVRGRADDRHALAAGAAGEMVANVLAVRP